MKPKHLKVARIGNSRGVRIPAVTLERYRIGDEVVMEERDDGILLKPLRTATPKLSWTETADAMRVAAEDWSDWEGSVADGLDHVVWHDADSQTGKRKVAESATSYRAKRPSKSGKAP